jgi:hypothetical protein
MNLQFIHDTKGNTTGVFIPIEEWQSLKDKYSDLQVEEENSSSELPEWQKKLLDERLSDYYKNPESSLTDFDEMLNDIRKTL